MTKREMFEAIVSGTVTEEVVEAAKAELEKLDKASARKASKAATAKAEADAPLFAKIRWCLGEAEGAMLVSTIASATGLSTQKTQALLRKMVDTGSVTVSDVKVKGVGMRKAYALA